MAQCEVCGNECAIQALAPTCGHCGIRIIGHGIESGGSYYCCGARDRVEAG